MTLLSQLSCLDVSTTLDPETTLLTGLLDDCIASVAVCVSTQPQLGHYLWIDRPSTLCHSLHPANLRLCELAVEASAAMNSTLVDDTPVADLPTVYKTYSSTDFVIGLFICLGECRALSSSKTYIKADVVTLPQAHPSPMLLEST